MHDAQPHTGLTTPQGRTVTGGGTPGSEESPGAGGGPDRSPLQSAQPFGGLPQDVLALAEGPADLGGVGRLVVVEDLVRDGDDAAALGEGAAEGEAVLLAEGVMSVVMK